MDSRQWNLYKEMAHLIFVFLMELNNLTASPTKTKTFLPFFGASGGGAITWRANFGQDSAGISSSQSPDNGIGTFEYDVPAGYKALCSANLPSLAITDAAEHFTPYLYTANNASTRAFLLGWDSNQIFCGLKLEVRHLVTVCLIVSLALVHMLMQIELTDQLGIH